MSPYHARMFQHEGTSDQSNVVPAESTDESHWIIVSCLPLYGIDDYNTCLACLRRASHRLFMYTDPILALILQHLASALSEAYPIITYVLC